MKAYLLLEDGTRFEGRSFGAIGSSGGEVVFNTAMTGYQEILTDPSYCGQIVVMTYPLIGNYGVNDEDVESNRIWASGLVVRQYTDLYSNWRATKSLGAYLKEGNVVGIEGIDTRALTRRIRTGGALRAVLATESTPPSALPELLRAVPSMEGLGLAARVACRAPYAWSSEGSRHAVVIDCGVKFNILRRLHECGTKVTVIPPTFGRSEILALRPDFLVVSNGPGDPAAVSGLARTLRSLLGSLPILGICLGHQLLALAVGAKTYKLKFGHHGANHPVRDERDGRIEITSQNHGFAVDGESLSRLDGKSLGRVKITHVHLSDGTIEGFELPDQRVKAVQYHPEASPGPHDASYLFEEFLGCSEKRSIA